MLQCAQCQSSNRRDAKFCETCGASMAEVAASERLADEAEAEVMLLEAKKAQSALAIVAGIQLVIAVVFVLFNMADATTGAVMIGIGLVFLALWWWAKRAPLAAAIVGLALFVTLHAAEAVANPESIFKGVIMKVIVVMILARAIMAGIKHRDFVRERGLG